MTYRHIRDVQQAIWPKVQVSLGLHKAQRAALTADSSVGAKARARVPWDRVVANETVWAAAKSDLLCTPEHQAVVKAAREWARYWGTDRSYLDEMDAEERALYDAVQTLLTTLRPPDDEDLRLGQNSSTVLSTTH